MNCNRVQSLITPFINNQIETKEIEEFVLHVENCPNCREELEVYYALLTAMRQLDEDKNLSDDFGLELSQKLERSLERVIHAKYTYLRKKSILFFAMILLAFFMSFRYANKSQENENIIIKSRFQLRVTFREERKPQIEHLLQQRLQEIELQLQYNVDYEY
jgi:hypothetical protein